LDSDLMDMLFDISIGLTKSTHDCLSLMLIILIHT
jgi:hypothetical protein